MHLSPKQVKCNLNEKNPSSWHRHRPVLQSHTLFHWAPYWTQINLSCIFNRTQKAPPAGGHRVLPAKDGIK